MNTKDHRAKKVLIVEDEIDICYLLTGILKTKNLQTTFVNSLQEANEKLHVHQPDIVFLDNHLPDGFGVEYITYVKQHYPTAKVVLITAHDTGADRENALTRGADVFIGKPFTREVIYKTIESLTH